MRAEGDQEQKPTDRGRYLLMQDEARARLAITPLSLPPAEPASSEHQTSSMTTQASSRAVLKQVQRVQSHTDTLTGVPVSLPRMSLTPVSPPSSAPPCSSPYNAEGRCFSSFRLYFLPLPLSLLLSGSLLFIALPSPPLHLSPSMPERRGKQQETAGCRTVAHTSCRH